MHISGERWGPNSACEHVRPNWDGLQPTDFQESFQLFVQTPTLTMMLFTLLIIWKFPSWPSLLLSIAWLFWVVHHEASITLVDIYYYAYKEGCIGPTLTYTIFCVLMAICLFSRWLHKHAIEGKAL